MWCFVQYPRICLYRVFVRCLRAKFLVTAVFRSVSRAKRFVLFGVFGLFSAKFLVL